MDKGKEIYWESDEMYVKGFRCIIPDLWYSITLRVYKISNGVRIWDVFQSNDEVWVKLQFLNTVSDKDRNKIKDELIRIINMNYEDYLNSIA